MIEKEILNKYLGWEYKSHGRGNGFVDCWGLILNVYKDLGNKLLDIEEDYDEKWSWKGRDLFIENYYSKWEKVPTHKLFDIVGFKNSKGIFFHAGIILRNNRFIHASKQGVLLSRLFSKEWAKIIEGFYHYKDLRL